MEGGSRDEGKGKELGGESTQAFYMRKTHRMQYLIITKHQK